jgi:hypothetical protein
VLATLLLAERRLVSAWSTARTAMSYVFCAVSTLTSSCGLYKVKSTSPFLTASPSLATRSWTLPEMLGLTEEVLGSSMFPVPETEVVMVILWTTPVV